MEKLNHVTTVAMLTDIVAESENNAKSGDVRVASEGRRMALVAGVLLTIVSNIPPDTFDNSSIVEYDAETVAAKEVELAAEKENAEKEEA